ncbi:DUF4190 domain-containing protein [Streptomyces sp. NPDC093097]|uniref:DUF4190 domain-containing protein n=1 Tax=Streptomyces sp. NPDC093097 TaxID=3366027 RepID=UPI0038307AD9
MSQAPPLNNPAQHPGYAAPAELPNGQAVASMVLGILGLLIIPIVLPIIALCLGISARRKADRGEAGGRGMAIAGIVLGSVGCALAVLAIVVAVVQFVSSGSL